MKEAEGRGPDADASTRGLGAESFWAFIKEPARTDGDGYASPPRRRQEKQHPVPLTRIASRDFAPQPRRNAVDPHYKAVDPHYKIGRRISESYAARSGDPPILCRPWGRWYDATMSYRTIGLLVIAMAAVAAPCAAQVNVSGTWQTKIWSVRPTLRQDGTRVWGVGGQKDFWFRGGWEGDRLVLVVSNFEERRKNTCKPRGVFTLTGTTV